MSRALGLTAALRRALASGLLLLACWATLAPAAALAAAQVDPSDIEDEVMCVQCSRPLSTSSGSAADQERALISAWIAQGLTKAQIKQKLVAEYGDRALVDDQSPVAAAAPWIAAIAGALSIGFLLHRRRQRDDLPADDAADGATANRADGDRSHADGAGDTATLSADDEARIDAELAERG